MTPMEFAMLLRRHYDSSIRWQFIVVSPCKKRFWARQHDTVTWYRFVVRDGVPLLSTPHRIGGSVSDIADQDGGIFYEMVEL